MNNRIGPRNQRDRLEFTTDRLFIRPFATSDAAFLISLLNDPAFIKNIGDRDVRTINRAELYILDRLEGSIAARGCALLHVSERSSGRAVGQVGFVHRDGIEGPDIGFSLLTDYIGRGYGFEAAQGLLSARPDLRPMFAITTLQNERSAALLHKLGFLEESSLQLTKHLKPSRLFCLRR